MSDLLIKNCLFWQIADNGSRAEVLRDQDILVQGNRIEAIQPTAIAAPSHFHM